MIRKIIFEGQEIEYTLNLKKVKNINLRIKIDGSILVSCPRGTSYSEIDRFVTANAKKIIDFKEKNASIKNLRAISLNLCDGEVFYILGEKKKIYNKISKKYNAYVVNDSLIIESPEQSNIEKKKAALEELLSEICKNETAIAMKKFQSFFDNEHIFSYPKITYKKMKTRWGSCIPSKNKISINKLLACTPRYCIEYVLLHELSHLVFPNHSKDFYSLVSKYVPNYKNIKKELSQYGIILSDF